MSKQRYEREIEEIMRRQRAEEARRAAPAPAPPRRFGGSGPTLPGPFNRMLTTPAERLVALAVALAVVSYLLRLGPYPMLPALVALLSAVLFFAGILGAAFGFVRPARTQYWRDRPIDIGSGGDLSRRLSYSWWRVRVGLRRFLGR